MYEEFEIRTSYKYLREVIKTLEEPVCILGGWAVFFHVNRNFQKAQGRPYIGSRDIDLGFHVKKDIGKKELERSALSQTLKILKEKLKFKPLSFRLYKEVHTETEEEIQEGQILPAHLIFPICIDIIVDNIPRNFRKVIGFNPIDEPLLEFVFRNKKYQRQIKEFNKKLIVPIPELLLAMKINSLPNRDKEHKKIKDICDIFAILWYTNINPTQAKKKVSKFIPEKDINKFLMRITQEDLYKASSQINHSAEEIDRVISLIRKI